MNNISAKSLFLHLAILAAFFLAQFLLPAFHHLALTRIMVLAVFALGYNILFGYTGLLSLGHAMFFAAGLYGAGLVSFHFAVPVPQAFLCGVMIAFAFSLLMGMITLRTSGVSFMIVTMLFAQVSYLASLYFSEFTRGEEGLMLPAQNRVFHFGSYPLDLTNADIRYNIAFGLLAFAFLGSLLLAQSRLGKALIAVRENEMRTAMLGYNVQRLKLIAFTLSGTLCGVAGAAYALLFAYIGASFGSIQYSIEALLFTLLGGAGTVIGPLLGTTLMFYLIDVASNYTSAYMLVVGVILVLLILFFPKGIMGTIRQRWAKWLP
jgi:branched-chain amino acid transport system permease protein